MTCIGTCPNAAATHAEAAGAGMGYRLSGSAARGGASASLADWVTASSLRPKRWRPLRLSKRWNSSVARRTHSSCGTPAWAARDITWAIASASPFKRRWRRPWCTSSMSVRTSPTKAVVASAGSAGTGSEDAAGRRATSELALGEPVREQDRPAWSS
jgi:hypothetical protein